MTNEKRTALAIVLGDAGPSRGELPIAPDPAPRERLTANAVDDALRMIVSAMGASGAILAERTPRGQSCLLARTGPSLHVPDAVEQFFSGIKGQSFSASVVAGQYACAAIARRGFDLLTLLVWSDGSMAFDDLTPLRVFLRMADPHREPRTAWRQEAAGGDGDSFPDGYVPASSPAMLETYRQMRMVAPADFPLLVAGETGVGKEHIVRILHAWSQRRRGPFVPVNCAAIPETLLEAELFGIGRGVATGVHERTGKFQAAEGGTLFLDEIGEIPLPLQAKLLRVLQDHEVTPVGARTVKADVRVIAATNAELEEKMRSGAFRSDLYYRIAGSVIHVPPLRDRKEDLPALIEYFLRTFAHESPHSVRGLSVAAMEVLLDYSWPGNVRELEHELRRLVYTCAPGQIIDAEALNVTPVPEARSSSALDLAARVAELERQLIAQALQRSRGNRSVAARLLGLSRNGLALKMQRLDSSATAP
jgi:DNA-binding NtrC family response regulator